MEYNKLRTARWDRFDRPDAAPLTSILGGASVRFRPSEGYTRFELPKRTPNLMPKVRMLAGGLEFAVSIVSPSVTSTAARGWL